MGLKEMFNIDIGLDSDNAKYVFAIMGAFAGFFVSGAYTHAMTNMPTLMKYFWGIICTGICMGIGWYIGGRQ